MTEHRYIPFNLPEIGEEEIREVVDVLRSGWLTTGERTFRFERDFRAYSGAKHALALSSGTAALHLPLAALGIGPGDEVITTPLTFCATVTCILHMGATPVLADVGPDGNIDPASIARRITSRTKAIMPVHLAGMPCRMDAIWNLARRHKLFVIEDAAHAAGAQYNGFHVGHQAACQSDAVAFSFYATKNITTGEGGMVATNSDELIATMKMLALHGISKDAWNRYSENGSWYYQVLSPGFKYNLSDLQSAIGIHQLTKLERFVAARTRLARAYTELLGDLEELELPAGCDYGRHCWHLYIPRLNLDKLTIDRDAFIRELRRRNIGASVHFIPIPLHPFFAPWAALKRNRCPRALELYSRIVSLPLYPSLPEADLEYIASAVREIVAGARKKKYLAAATPAE